MELPFLQNLGLTRNEADLYELLLQTGEVSAKQLLVKTPFKRTTAYTVLYALEKKGLVSKYDKNKIIHFKPESPTKLLDLAEQQYRILERTKKDVQAVIPQMISNYILSVEKPVVTNFEGVEGLKKIYEDMLRVGKPIYAVLQLHEIDEQLHTWLKGPFVRKRAKLGIPAQVIVSSNAINEEYVSKNKKEARTTIMVSEEEFPFTHELNIYGDKVAFMNFKKGESLIGVVIDHPQVARTMKAMFNLAWKGAESMQQ